MADGSKVLIPGIMEHIEKTGVHSGDSISVYPAANLKKRSAGPAGENYHQNCERTEGGRPCQYSICGSEG